MSVDTIPVQHAAAEHWARAAFLEEQRALQNDPRVELRFSGGGTWCSRLSTGQLRDVTARY